MKNLVRYLFIALAMLTSSNFAASIHNDSSSTLYLSIPDKHHDGHKNVSNPGQFNTTIAAGKSKSFDLERNTFISGSVFYKVFGSYNCDQSGGKCASSFEIRFEYDKAHWKITETKGSIRNSGMEAHTTDNAECPCDTAYGKNTNGALACQIATGLNELYIGINYPVVIVADTQANLNAIQANSTFQSLQGNGINLVKAIQTTTITKDIATKASQRSAQIFSIGKVNLASGVSAHVKNFNSVASLASGIKTFVSQSLGQVTGYFVQSSLEGLRTTRLPFNKAFSIFPAVAAKAPNCSGEALCEPAVLTKNYFNMPGTKKKLSTCYSPSNAQIFSKVLPYLDVPLLTNSGQFAALTNYTNKMIIVPGCSGAKPLLNNTITVWAAADSPSSSSTSGSTPAQPTSPAKEVVFANTVKNPDGGASSLSGWFIFRMDTFVENFAQILVHSGKNVGLSFIQEPILVLFNMNFDAITGGITLNSLDVQFKTESANTQARIKQADLEKAAKALKLTLWSTYQPEGYTASDLTPACASSGS